jgi:hypothetical protein
MHLFTKITSFYVVSDSFTFVLMLLNISYKNPKQEQTITELVGKPFSLRERLTLSGVGSPKLIIISSSPKIANLLLLDNNQDICNVELRPKGLIIRFRSLLETYAIIIPYYKLSIFKGTASSYTIHAEAKKIEVEMDRKVTRFFSKITKQKAAYLSDFK